MAADGAAAPADVEVGLGGPPDAPQRERGSPDETKVVFRSALLSALTGPSETQGPQQRTATAATATTAASDGDDAASEVLSPEPSLGSGNENYEDTPVGDTASHVEDLEADPKPKAAAPERRRRRCGRRAVILSALLSSVILGLAALLWPRSPDWRIAKLDMDTKEFAAVVLGSSSGGKPVPIAADVEFFNPNFVGTSTKEGVVKVYYEGELFARGTVGAFTVGPRSSATIHTSVLVSLAPELGRRIFEDIKANKMQLRVFSDATLVAHTGPFAVKVTSQCHIRADTTKVWTAKEEIIGDKVCTTRFGL